MSLADLLGTATSTFGGTGFYYSPGKIGTLHRRGRIAVYDRQKIPYGTTSIIQSAGVDTPPSQITVVVADETISALEGKVGTSATLALIGNSSVTAYLASCVQGEQYADGFSLVQLTFEY